MKTDWVGLFSFALSLFLAGLIWGSIYVLSGQAFGYIVVAVFFILFGLNAKEKGNEIQFNFKNVNLKNFVMGFIFFPMSIWFLIGYNLKVK